MEEFTLKTKEGKVIPILEGIPEEYNNYSIPNMQGFYAKWGEEDENTCIFQIRKILEIEIVVSYYITPVAAQNSILNLSKRNLQVKEGLIRRRKYKRPTVYAELLCTSTATCIELHTMLQGNVQIELNNFKRRRIKSGLYNLIYLPYVKNHTWFYEPLTITFDLHIPSYILDKLKYKSHELKDFLRSIVVGEGASVHKEYGNTTPELYVKIHHMLEILIDERDIDENLLYTKIIEYISMILRRPEADAIEKYEYNKLDIVREYARGLKLDMRNKNAVQDQLHKLGLTSKSVMSLFKRMYGMTPKRFVYVKNMEVIKNYLEMDYELNDLIDKTRFRDFETMGRAFHKEYGMTMTEYRNQKKKK